MNARALLVALPLVAVACSGAPSAATPSPSARLSPTPVAATSPSPSFAPDRQPPQAAQLACVAKPAGGPLVVVGSAIYEVTDATRPRLLCTFGNTSVHLLSLDTFAYLVPSQDRTYVYIHSLTRGDDLWDATIPSFYVPDTWTPDGKVAAWVDVTYADPEAMTGATFQISLFAQGKASELVHFEDPEQVFCNCRFETVPKLLTISPDGAYLAVGWRGGKGAVPVTVYRVADRKLVMQFDAGYTQAFWAPSGHRLFVGSPQAAGLWTPDAGLVELEGAAGWAFEPSPSPDGMEVAFTADQRTGDPKTIRAFVYDLAAKKTSVLINQPRSEVLFVKPGWVWYRREVLCNTSGPTCGPWGTLPTDTVIAMDLTTHAESPVRLASGQPMDALPYGWAAGDFWPIA